MGCLPLLVLPVIDLLLLWMLGGRLGAGPTMGLVVGTALIGVVVARAEGLRVVREVQRALRERQPPELAAVSSFLVVAGGVLLVWPGPAGDVAGLVLLLPRTRALVAEQLRRRWERAVATGRVKVSVAGGFGGATGWSARPPARDFIDVEARPVGPPLAGLPAPADPKKPGETPE